MCSWTQWNVKCKQVFAIRGKYPIDYGNDDENEDDGGDKDKNTFRDGGWR